MSRKESAKMLGQGESQTVEFKTSLAEEQDAIRAMVAFANAQGGKVFFGVRNDGTPVGVTIGQNTIEVLANAIKVHIYPSLPVSIEEFNYGGKQILMVESPKDVPPIVGVYLYSGNNIPAANPVDATGLQAYRRVGRTNQKEDFMRLRQPLPSDPDIVIRLNGAGRQAGEFFPASQGFYYSNSGQGWAHRVAFHADHKVYRLQTGPKGISLPPPDQEDPHHQAHVRQSEVRVLNADLNIQSSDPVSLTATYEDANGFTWQSVLELSPTCRGNSKPLYDFEAGRFQRRIITFPPRSV